MMEVSLYNHVAKRVSKMDSPVTEQALKQSFR